ncbi:Hit family protein 1 [Zancudomyces culisetae]|uniref:Hit family protein 1 n=1 Tax=Zancudomyces culisetae TaxID=1213189 RepID=A0A1R1PSN1_ZANCU|nr:Hit family protein 1 [Zancudomyces culisetae]|eukprot:OMH83892.1 Hit family protein 1 [Zancudomyces culisetae]
MSSPSCLFCKIISGAIPSYKLYETSKVFAFLDIGPISKKHCLIIPKHHGEKLHDIPDDYLSEILPVAKKLSKAIGCEDYNILQNNGKLAHQEVKHVHFHLIPKWNANTGLKMGWEGDEEARDSATLASFAEELKNKL